MQIQIFLTIVPFRKSCNDAQSTMAVRCRAVHFYFAFYSLSRLSCSDCCRQVGTIIRFYCKFIDELGSEKVESLEGEEQMMMMTRELLDNNKTRVNVSVHLETSFFFHHGHYSQLADGNLPYSIHWLQSQSIIDQKKTMTDGFDQIYVADAIIGYMIVDCADG